ncbi:MAG TPA: phage tail protein [Buttiauxella sp.]|jgi:uncharacterized protein YjdB
MPQQNAAQVKTKGASTSFWLYTGAGDPFAAVLTDTEWSRSAGVKTLQLGELTAQTQDDSYLDDPDADWESKSQGVKSAGETSITLAWKPGETGQQKLLELFYSGDVQAYKIKYPNGTVDVFRAIITGFGKSVTANETITRAVKFTNIGKPSLAEDTRTPVVAVTGVTLTPPTVSVAVGASADITLAVLPAGATDATFRVASADPTTVTVTLSGNKVTVKGIKTGKVDVVAMSNDGGFVGVSTVTVA